MNNDFSESVVSEAPVSYDSLRSLRSELQQFAKDRDWDQYHTPRNLLLALNGEVGELCELFQWRGEVSPGLPEFNQEEKIRVGEELSDCLLYLLRLADRCDIDIGTAVADKLQKNALKYPVHLSKGSMAKYDTFTKGIDPKEQ